MQLALAAPSWYMHSYGALLIIYTIYQTIAESAGDARGEGKVSISYLVAAYQYLSHWLQYRSWETSASRMLLLGATNKRFKYRPLSSMITTEASGKEKRLDGLADLGSGVRAA